MGASSSCNGADYGPMDQSLEALIMKTINFNDEDVRTAIRSFSFNGRESEPLLAIGPRKMIIEGSLSFKGREPGPFNMKTKSPRKIPQVQKIGSPVATGPRTSRFMAAAKAAVQQNATFKPGSPKHEAALKLQKVYKSFRTRRKLADCAVLAEQQWWKLLDFALLKRSSVSFFDIDRPESVVSRWSRARTRAAKVGKGLSKDEKAQKLALQHWLEAIDPRHRYGHNLHFYYSAWLHCESRQPFFYWLDVGEGKEVNLERCPRSRLRQECIKYLGPKEREEYEVEVKEGKFMYKNSRNLLDTSQGPPEAKWIFVLSTSRKLYVGQKKKGTFQHSSFLAGGATSSAGRLVVERGILKAIWPHSGHYLPTERNFQEFVSFLKEKNVDLTDVKRSPDDESEWGSAASSLPNPVAAAPDETGAKEAATQQLHGSASDQANAPGKSTGTGGAAAPKEEPISGTPLARRRPALSKLKVERTAIDRLYALYLQRVFKEFQESDEDTDDDKTSSSSDSDDKVSSDDDSPNCSFSPGNPHAATGGATEKRYKTNLDGEETVVVSRESILQRINTKKGMKSYQLGKQLSCRWTTGAGPRIGCVRDYPSELQFQALEQVNLSPRCAGISRLGPSSSRSLPGSAPTPWTPGAPSPLRVSASAETIQATPAPSPAPLKVSASAETLQPSSRR